MKTRIETKGQPRFATIEDYNKWLAGDRSVAIWPFITEDGVAKRNSAYDLARYEQALIFKESILQLA